MTARALQWVGLFAIVALVGVGIGSLMIVKDRIDITIQEPGSGTAPDPLALVRDDLTQVHADLDAMNKALRENLEIIGKHLADQAVARGDDQNLLRREHAEVQKRLQALERGITQQEAIRARLAAIEAQLRAFRPRGLDPSAPGAGQAAASSPGIAATIRSASPASAPAQPPPQPQPEPEPRTAAAPTEGTEKSGTAAAPQPKGSAAAATTRPPARPSGFMAFRLPSRGFQFDKRQRFKILDSLSRVGFDAKSTLHDFSGVTSKVRGEFVANLADSRVGWSGRIDCDAAALRTGVDGRDAGLRDHLLTKTHPRIQFAIKGFRPSRTDVAKRTAAGTVTGAMTIRGKTRPFEMPVKISLDASRRVVIEGQAALRLTDYDVPVPSQLGMISMEDEVKVWIALRARGLGTVGDGR